MDLERGEEKLYFQFDNLVSQALDLLVLSKFSEEEITNIHVQSAVLIVLMKHNIYFVSFETKDISHIFLFSGNQG